MRKRLGVACTVAAVMLVGVVIPLDHAEGKVGKQGGGKGGAQARKGEGGVRTGAPLAGTMVGVPQEGLIRRVLTQPAILDEMADLSDEQKKKLRDGLDPIQTKVAELRTGLTDAAQELDRIMKDGSADSELASKAVEKAGEARTQVAKEYVKAFFIIKGVLTPEQMEKLQQNIQTQQAKRSNDGTAKAGGAKVKAQGKRGKRGAGTTV